VPPQLMSLDLGSLHRISHVTPACMGARISTTGRSWILAPWQLLLTTQYGFRHGHRYC
jgi:hypothetical protein